MKSGKLCLVILLLTLVLGSCNNKAAEPGKKSQFCLTDTLQKKAVIDEVKMETVKNVLALSGKIEANEDKWIKVFPVVGGIVEELKVQLGDHVTKGQVLAVVRSSEIADYQNQFSSAQSNLNIAQKNLQASEDMFKSGLATERDVVASRNELQKAKGELNRIQQTVRIYGARNNALQSIVAPVSGYVIEKNVTDKMHFRVDGSQPFFVISNLDEVWVIASVFESDIAIVKEGYDADINVIAYKDKIFKGKVDRIFSILDPQSRVMKVRIKIPNKDNLLKPEMFAQINIKYGGDANQLPAIPAKAIIFDKNKNYVMVYKDRCNIETREIEISQTVGGMAYIKSGLSTGEKIITQYQLLVYEAMND